MKVEKRDGQTERNILTGLIVSKTVVARIAPKWEKPEGLFRSPWANLVGQWCVDYFNKYGKPPAREIEGLFRAWADKGKKDKDTVALVEKFLGGLSGEYEAKRKKLNPEFLADQAADHFTRVKLQKLAESIQGNLDAGRAEDAVNRPAAFNKVEVSSSRFVDVLNDQAAVKEVYEHRRESLISWPGDLGRFYGNEFEREAFIAYLAPPKRGKCVSEDMEVLLADGRIRTIREIVESGDPTPVVTLDETAQKVHKGKVTQFWDNGEKMCYRVMTRTGRTVITTSNHKYLTPGGWKEIGEIEPGEYIAVPRRLPFFGNHRLRSAEVRFLAFMLAEGCTVQNHYDYGTSTSCNFTNTDPVLIRRFKKDCRALGFRVRHRGISYYLRKEAVRYLKEHGMIGCTAKTKTIPSVIFSCTKDQIARFLRVFFTCDGCIYRDRGRRKIELTLANERLVRQVAHLLTRFGIVSSVSYSPASCNGKVFDAWRLLIQSQEEIDRFLREINFLSYKRTEPSGDSPGRSFIDVLPPKVAARMYLEMKAAVGPRRMKKVYGLGIDRVRETIRKGGTMMRKTVIKIRNNQVCQKYLESDVLWDRVEEVRCVGMKKTYDLGVPVTHNFVANDCIVHNTYQLLDVAWRAMSQRKRVAFFEVGDLSLRQILSRFYTRALGRPLKATHPDRPVLVPVKLEAGDSPIPDVEFDTRVYKSDATLQEIEAAIDRAKMKTKSKDPYLRVQFHPTKSITARGVKAALLDWSRDGWTADVVVVDYADILAPSHGFKESRDAVNDTWQQLRRMSQELHCCVVTATQGNAASFNTDSLDMSNFSEDNRKLAHVTGMIAINQKQDEKKQQLQRLGWVVLREDEFHVSRQIWIANCLAIANPTVRTLLM